MGRQATMLLSSIFVRTCKQESSGAHGSTVAGRSCRPALRGVASSVRRARVEGAGASVQVRYLSKNSFQHLQQSSLISTGSASDISACRSCSPECGFQNCSRRHAPNCQTAAPLVTKSQDEPQVNVTVGWEQLASGLQKGAVNHPAVLCGGRFPYMQWCL